MKQLFFLSSLWLSHFIICRSRCTGSCDCDKPYWEEANSLPNRLPPSQPEAFFTLHVMSSWSRDVVLTMAASSPSTRGIGVELLPLIVRALFYHTTFHAARTRACASSFRALVVPRRPVCLGQVAVVVVSEVAFNNLIRQCHFLCYGRGALIIWYLLMQRSAWSRGSIHNLICSRQNVGSGLGRMHFV